MKNLTVLLLVVSSVVVFYCCQLKSKKIESETYSELQEKGDKISNVAQGVLLANVGNAIQQGGTEYAVEFCTLEVSGITDSLNEANNCRISRISAKNRNPQNSLKSEKETKIWQVFQSQNIKDTLIRDNNKLVYYKQIRVGLPACLKCHGVPESDIDPATLKKIQTLYPNDLATGYKLNDFRGLWKIAFSK